MKVKKTVALIFVSICFILSCFLGWFAWEKNETFWNVNAAQVLTLIVSIGVAFIATQIINDERKNKEHAEKVINRIQQAVSDTDFFVFTDKSSKEKITLSNRAISNSINILNQYGKKLKFQNDVDYIKAQMNEYKDFVSEHIEDLEYLCKSSALLKKYADNIYNKCDEIVLKLY